MDLHEMMPIPAGTVSLRDARTGTTRDVDLQAFQLSRSVLVPRGEDQPAASITWFDAIRFCNQLSEAHGAQKVYTIDGRRVTWTTTADGYRLPTEAEWEYACRAGTTGAQYGDLREIAWTGLDGVTSAQPVERREPNAFGLHDMLGNVWEWCWDYLDPARYGEYRVFRGGSFADPPWSVRASVRRGSAPDAVIEGTGLRVARQGIPQAYGRDAQGWSAVRDRERASIGGFMPVGWTPLHELRDEPASRATSLTGERSSR
nr:SUMF1/EgtB/PvdO family nonheme iron enzyme [Cryobacterium sp. 1639]